MQKVKHDFQVAKQKCRLEMSTWYETAVRIALLFSIVTHVYSPSESAPEEFPNIKQIIWNGARVIKFERARTRFLSVAITLKSDRFLLWRG